MNKIITTVIILLAVSVIGLAQEKGKIGCRTAIGFSTLHDQLYKFNPILVYSAGIVFLEKEKPFSIKYEVSFESKGGLYEQGKNKFKFTAMSLNILPQIKFKSNYNHTLISGIYLSYLSGPYISPTLPPGPPPYIDGNFSHFDIGVVLAYKYTFLRSKGILLQLDPRINYSIFNINNHLLGDSKWTRNAVFQLGFNFILNNKN